MSNSISDILSLIDGTKPVLIAGPTASGKSALAMAVAKKLGGPVVNADAIQVYSDWRILTARPDDEDLGVVAHALYGHVPGDQPYSVGHWLKDVSVYLDGPPPVIVGGTGLYFSALTEGLADIPPTATDLREIADRRIANEGFETLLAELDAETATRIDCQNPMRVQRAWEVLTGTGRGLAEWQDETGTPLLPLEAAQAFALSAPREWLTPRIERRLDHMIEGGLLNEAIANAPTWHSGLASAKAIGAAEMVAHVTGSMTLEEAREKITVLTRQYAKRQRSWFRSRMQGWTWLDANTDSG